MVERNSDIARYQADYLFVDIARRKERLLQEQPDAKLISLGIGDTTEPIPDMIIHSFVEQAKQLGTTKGYRGYGAALGDPSLRKKIANILYQDRISSDDIFISDGSKCDLGRLQFLFGSHSSLAIQDPSYPAYVAASVMSGKTGAYNTDNGQYRNITYLPCRPENAFFPDLEILPETDLIYICSPNNPTGTVLTHAQLQKLVKMARERGAFIIFDSAYAGFIRDSSLPKSIYEIEGAQDVAIELGSFSKTAGFTGVRLGWTVIPKQLCFDDGTPVQNDWSKIVSTFFNGASNIAQAGGLAILSDEGITASQSLCDLYLENANILREAIESKNYTCFGGENAPYLWVDIKGEPSWKLFDKLLKKGHLVTTPGAGFGPAGEGFLRLSAFGRRVNIIEAAQRLKEIL